MRSTSSTLDPVARSDSELMAEAAAGSVEAFDQLYERYCARAYRLALGVCGDHALTEDAMQEAFLSIWRNSASYRAQRGTVAAWVLTVVRHRAIDLARRHGTTVDRQSDVKHLGSHTAADDDPYEEAGAREQADHLRALLNRLPDPQHEVVTLAFYGQLTHAEISEQLGLPPGTVKGRMRLGMHKLREELSRPTPDARASGVHDGRAKKPSPTILGPSPAPRRSDGQARTPRLGDGRI